jgi:hypothetical protein
MDYAESIPPGPYYAAIKQGGIAMDFTPHR